MKFANDCYNEMLGYIPPDIFSSSLPHLTQDYQMNMDCAKRIFTKKCLWLLRCVKTDMMRFHEVDLLGPYTYEAQGLDVVELAALYKALPEEFIPDTSGRKKTWRSGLETTLKKLLLDMQNGKLEAAKKRNQVYKRQKPLFAGNFALHSLSSGGQDAIEDAIEDAAPSIEATTIIAPAVEANWQSDNNIDTERDSSPSSPMKKPLPSRLQRPKQTHEPGLETIDEDDQEGRSSFCVSASHSERRHDSLSVLLDGQIETTATILQDRPILIKAPAQMETETDSQKVKNNGENIANKKQNLPPPITSVSVIAATAESKVQETNENEKEQTARRIPVRPLPFSTATDVAAAALKMQARRAAAEAASETKTDPLIPKENGESTWNKKEETHVPTLPSKVQEIKADNVKENGESTTNEKEQVKI
jgi:hypothetical protein